MIQPIDGPGVQGSLSATTTAAEIKVGASPISERKLVVIQPIDGKVYWGYNSNVSSTTGFLVGKRQVVYIEASEQLSIYVVSESGTVDLRVAEVS